MIALKFIFKATTTMMLALVSMIAFSQDRWQEGYVLHADGDSVFAEIDVVLLEDVNEKCVFRNSETKKQETVEASEIKTVRILAGRKFVTKSFVLDDAKVTAIVEYLVDGVADVYVYKKNGEDIFLLESESKPLTVARFGTQKATSPNPAAKEVEVRSYRHIGLLKAFMSDAPTLHEQINTMHMNQKNLVDITEQYHDLTCSTGASCIIYKKDGIYSTSMFAPVITGAMYSIRLTEKENGKIIDFARAFGGGIGSMFTFPVYRKGIKLDFEAEASFTRSSHSATFAETDAANENIHYLSFDYSALRFNPGIRISVRPKKLTYTAFAGPSVALGLSENMENNEDIYMDGTFQVNYEYNDLAYSSGLIGLRGYVGIMFKISNNNLLHLMLGYETLTGSKPMTNLYTTGSREYKISESSANLKMAVYF